MQYGYNLGMAFQLIDDLLDYTGKKNITGKPLYGDLNNRVVTLPLIRTMSAVRYQNSISNHFLQNKASASQIDEVAQAVIEGDGPEYTYRKAEVYAKRAAALIDEFGPDETEKKNILEHMAKDVLLRSK